MGESKGQPAEIQTTRGGRSHREVEGKEGRRIAPVKPGCEEEGDQGSDRTSSDGLDEGEGQLSLLGRGWRCTHLAEQTELLLGRGSGLNLNLSSIVTLYLFRSRNEESEGQADALDGRERQVRLVANLAALVGVNVGSKEYSATNDLT